MFHFPGSHPTLLQDLTDHTVVLFPWLTPHPIARFDATLKHSSRTSAAHSITSLIKEKSTSYDSGCRSGLR